MKIFIDTANVEDIKQASELGVIKGVTTNPSLIAKEGRDLKEVIEEICKVVDGPISCEVLSLDSEGMIREGREFASLHPNIVIKIPMTKEGLKAVKILSDEKINTNVTLVFSASQALLASLAGATYVSPFIGRLDDISMDGYQLIDDIVTIFDIHNIKTEIIAASIRHTMHVVEAAKLGAHIATVPFKIIEQMVKHPLTDKGIEKFIEDWDRTFNKK